MKTYLHKNAFVKGVEFLLYQPALSGERNPKPSNFPNIVTISITL